MKVIMADYLSVSGNLRNPINKDAFDRREDFSSW